MCGAKLDILFNLPVKFQNYLLGVNNYTEFEFYLRAVAAYEKTIYRIYFFP
jgi:hypothetical protein